MGTREFSTVFILAPNNVGMVTLLMLVPYADITKKQQTYIPGEKPTTFFFFWLCSDLGPSVGLPTHYLLHFAGRNTPECGAISSTQTYQ